MRENNRRVSFLFILLFTTIASCFAAAPSSASENITYTRSQVDSLITMEVRRQVDTQLIDLKIQKASTDLLKTYISTESNNLSLLAIIITLLTAIVGIMAPVFINKQHEKLIDDRLKDNKDKTDKYVEDNKEKVDQLINNGLQKVNTSLNDFDKKLIEQLDFSVSFIRALTNDDEDIRYNSLEEIIKTHSDKSYISYVYNSRGNVFMHKKKYDSAILDYTKAIELNPMFADAYYNRGSVYVKLDKYQEAIKDYMKAIELNPNGVDYYWARGNAYVAHKDYDQAIIDYTKAIEMNSDCADYYLSRGTACYLKEDYIRTIEDYTKAIELNPRSVISYLKRGSVFSQIGAIQNAIEDYTKAIELKPQIGEAYLFRGDEYMKIGNKRKAKADYKRAMKYGFNGYEDLD